ncbi:diacylglycerol kinase gamma-like [Alexandromys fortis]|uniref:diacylglycerol kinase gamma-like n=1 Tax=Alexandromys fortis TaxID=100897 RepID=UPI0021533AAA|nr:diacylglycerol kinase gamma-like [Microtus fortis]
MSEGRWVSLSSEEFDQLQKYAEYSSKKIKDVLTEFNEGGSLKQCDTHKPISYDVFKLFMRAYLEVDLPLPLSTHLFLAFSQKPRQETPDHPKEGASSSEPNVSDCNADNAAKADEACAPDTALPSWTSTGTAETVGDGRVGRCSLLSVKDHQGGRWMRADDWRIGSFLCGSMRRKDANGIIGV